MSNYAEWIKQRASAADVMELHQHLLPYGYRMVSEYRALLQDASRAPCIPSSAAGSTSWKPPSPPFAALPPPDPETAAVRTTPLRLFLTLMAFFAWLALSVLLLRGWVPALVSSRDTALVLFGFAIPFVWLAANAALAWHLFTKRRAAATHTE